MTQVRLCLLVFRRSGAKHLPPPLHIYFYPAANRVKTIHKYLDFRWHVCKILQVHTTYIFAEIKLLVVKIAKTPSDLPIRTMDIKLPLYCYEHASEHKKLTFDFVSSFVTWMTFAEILRWQGHIRFCSWTISPSNGRNECYRF